MVRYWPNGGTVAPPRPGQVRSGFRATSEFGAAHDITNGHRGIDTVGHTYNYAAESGTVIYAGNNGTAGWEIRVRGDSGHILRYLHNEPWSLEYRSGQRVAAGARLGKMGYSGYTIPSGPNGRHSHFEVIAPNGVTRINPRAYIAAGGQPSGGGGGSTIYRLEDEMKILIKPGGDCFMVTTKPRIKHIGTMTDLRAAEKTFGPAIACTDTEFRVALIGLGIPYDKAVKGADWRG